MELRQELNPALILPMDAISKPIDANNSFLELLDDHGVKLTCR